MNYNEAKKNYNIVASQYPNSSKAPRALYQLYSIAKDVDKNTVSANQYKNKLLTQYPKSEEAKFFKNNLGIKKTLLKQCLFYALLISVQFHARIAQESQLIIELLEQKAKFHF